VLIAAINYLIGS